MNTRLTFPRSAAAVVLILFLGQLALAQKNEPVKNIGKLLVTKAFESLKYSDKTWLLSVEDDSASYEVGCVLHKNGRSSPPVDKQLLKQKSPYLKDVSCGPFAVGRSYEATIFDQGRRMIIFDVDSSNKMVTRMVAFEVTTKRPKESEKN
jgi:hypothetical protein